MAVEGKMSFLTATHTQPLPKLCVSQVLGDSMHGSIQPEKGDCSKDPAHVSSDIRIKYDPLKYYCLHAIEFCMFTQS